MRQHPAHESTEVDPTSMVEAEREKPAAPATAGGQPGKKPRNRGEHNDALPSTPSPASGSLDDVFRALEAQRQASQGRLSELDRERQRVAGELERITAAIAALKGSPGKAPRMGAPSAAGQAYTTAEVGTILAEELKAGPLSEVELKTRLEARAKAAGRNRSGLHLRLRDALKDPRFTQAGGKWNLA